MKSIASVLFAIAGCIPSVSWAHADIAWTYPLYIQCEQLDNKLNGWTARHLFLFEQKGNPDFKSGEWQNVVVKGKYKSHVYITPSSDKELRATEVEGIASFNASNIHDLYDIDAIGFMTKFDDKTGIPQVVMGATVIIGEKDASNGKRPLSQFNVMDKTIRLMPRDYSAECRILTAEEVAKF